MPNNLSLRPHLMRVDDFWNKVPDIKAGLQRLAAHHESFKPLRYSFNRFANREQVTINADDLSKELSSALVSLYLTASGLSAVTMDPAEMTGLAEQLDSLTKQVNEFLVSYHYISPDAATLGTSPPRDKRLDLIEQKDALIANMRELDAAFKAYQKETTQQFTVNDSGVKLADVSQKFDPRQDFSAGVEFGKPSAMYKLIGTPRRGTFNVVWRAKYLSPQPLAAKFYQRKIDFEREWAILKKLPKTSTSNVVRLSAVFQDLESTIDPYSVLVMDYCEITLQEFWTCQTFEPTMIHARVIIADIIRGLEACHAADVVHCNLRPTNVMLYTPVIPKYKNKRQDAIAARRYTRWMLVDFDSARTVGELVTIKSIEYAPPEVAAAYVKGKFLQANAAMDMWSVGRILHFLAARNVPYWPKDATKEQLLEFLSSGRCGPPPGVKDSDAKDALEALLRVDPEQRMTLEGIKASKFMTQVAPTRDLKLLRLQAIETIERTITDIEYKIGRPCTEDEKVALGKLELLFLQLDRMPRLMPCIFAIRPIDFPPPVSQRLEPGDTGPHVIRTLARNAEKLKHRLQPDHIMLHFFCEAEIPHIADHPGYKLTQASKFVKAYNRPIGLALSLLQCVLKMPQRMQTVPPALYKWLGHDGPAAVHALYEWTLKELKDATDRVKKEALNQLTLDLNRISDGKLIQVSLEVQQALIRELNDGESMDIGNLTKCTLENGRIAWLCRACAQQHQ